MNPTMSTVSVRLVDLKDEPVKLLEFDGDATVQTFYTKALCNDNIDGFQRREAGLLSLPRSTAGAGDAGSAVVGAVSAEVDWSKKLRDYKNSTTDNITFVLNPNTAVAAPTPGGKASATSRVPSETVKGYMENWFAESIIPFEPLPAREWLPQYPWTPDDITEALKKPLIQRIPANATYDLGLFPRLFEYGSVATDAHIYISDLLAGTSVTSKVDSFAVFAPLMKTLVERYTRYRVMLGNTHPENPFDYMLLRNNCVVMVGCHVVPGEGTIATGIKKLQDSSYELSRPVLGGLECILGVVVCYPEVQFVRLYGRCEPVSRCFNLSEKDDVIDFVVAWFNSLRWIAKYTQYTPKLPLPPFITHTIHRNAFGINVPTKVTICGWYVEKTSAVPADRVEIIEEAYSSCSWRGGLVKLYESETPEKPSFEVQVQGDIAIITVRMERPGWAAKPQRRITWVRMLNDALQGLAALHSDGLCHCNVRLENILKTQDDEGNTPGWMLTSLDRVTGFSEPVAFSEFDFWPTGVSAGAKWLPQYDLWQLSESCLANMKDEDAELQEILQTIRECKDAKAAFKRVEKRLEAIMYARESSEE